MKLRSGFVSNSSTSSFICDICGNHEEGMDIGIRECGMRECVNGHVICDDDLLCDVSREMLIAYFKANDNLPDGWEEMDDDDLESEAEEFDYQMPPEMCPICQFVSHSNSDIKRYLFKIYGVPDAEVFAIVKADNKRRKKLYDNEYVDYVLMKNSTNIITVVADIKDKFKTYALFMKYLDGKEVVEDEDA